MLEIISCRRPEDKAILFNNFDPRAATWVVSDLQSKWHLQRQLLNRHQVLEGTAILRATELWKHFAFQLQPEARLLSLELAQTLFWDWVRPLNLPWARSPQIIPILINQMQMWMSLFADPQYEDIMSQWFKDNAESYVRWGHWFELCAQIWQRCQSENLVLLSWLPALLLNRDLKRLTFARALTFDLGPQISQVEGLLIRALGQDHEVRVIYPQAPWVSLMKNALRPYDELLNEPYLGDSEWQPNVDQSLQFGRFSTQLAEVKDSVSQVRAWLDSGVELKKIALVAPDIEHYWPALQLYLQQEGIAVNKPVTARLGSFVEMARWLAALRTLLGKISSADLEVQFFTDQEQPPRLDFAEFRVLFSQIYDAQDLRRAEHLFNAAQDLDFSASQTGQDFLLWALRYWQPRSDFTRLKYLLQVIGQEVPRQLQLLPTQWLSYWEGLFARRELSLIGADAGGVWCVSLSSADWLDISHAVFLNLSEGGLRRIEPSPVSASEAQKIFTDTGYALGMTDLMEREFEFLWFLKREWLALKLNFAATDFSGEVQTPSRFWMWAGFANDCLKTRAELPGHTRWHEIQKLPLSELAVLREFSAQQTSGLEIGLERDFSLGVPNWGLGQDLRVSASSLESYWNCPFIFAAQRKLRLSDDPVLDLDLDRRTRGNLLHAMVEHLLSDPAHFALSDEAMGVMVDDIRQQQGIRMGDERLWPVVRAQHVRLARLFLQFEKDWRARFPATTTVARELDFSCHWNLQEGKPQLEKTAIAMLGRVDRIDKDSAGRYALLDYKASANTLTNWQSWLGNYKIQLALYALLLERGMMGLEPSAVVAANYYVVKDSDRSKGYHLRDPEAELYAGAATARNFITDQQKAELFSNLQQEIQLALSEMAAGQFNPHPVDEKKCPSCSWRTLCRAPHLN